MKPISSSKERAWAVRTQSVRSNRTARGTAAPLVALQVAAPQVAAASIPAAGLMLALSCAGSGLEPRSSDAPLIVEGAALAPYTNPAHFRYHPRERARTRAERELSGGQRLLVGERGERWLFDARSQSISPGGMLAPETLIAVLQDAQSFWFIGESGTSYAANSALAPFVRSSAPVEALKRVTAAGSTIEGVRQGRELLRSADFGLSWSNLPLGSAAIVDVALAPDGRGLALGTPESMWQTQDFGATFQLIPNYGSNGTLELETSPEGQILSRGPLGTRLWNGTDFVTIAPATPTKSAARGYPAPPRGPDAGAIREGRATIDGPRYWELLNLRGTYRLLSGPLDGVLHEVEVPAAQGCRAVRLAASGRYVSFACFRDAAEVAARAVEVYASRDSGRNFERLPGQLRGSLVSFRFALDAEGHFLASGVCAPGAAVAGCAVSGVQRQRLASDEARQKQAASKLPTEKKQSEKKQSSSEKKPSEAAELGAANQLGVVVPTPALLESALALAVSSDGKFAYAVARRNKASGFALFVSRDGGHTFTPEPLDLGQIASDDDDSLERAANTRVESLSVAEDGSVAITFVHYGHRVLAVTDEQGKVLAAAEPPEADAWLAAAGLRALAIAPKSRQVWESLDGGVTWNSAGVLPNDPCPGEDDCELPVFCASHGCVIGRDLSRIGWGLSEGDEAGLLPPPLRPLRPVSDRRLRTPLACNLVPGNFTALPEGSAPPDAQQAALGGVQWFSFSEDPARAEVKLFSSSAGKVSATTLFEAVPTPERYAYRVLDQIEGVAAIRYRVPEEGSGKTRLTDVEAAWSNLIEHKTLRQKLGDGGEYFASDYVRGKSASFRADPDLVSIAAGGLYLRLHAASQTDQPTLFLDGKHVEVLAPLSWPKLGEYPSRDDIVHVAGKHVPIAIVSHGAALVRARLNEPSGPSFDAAATGMIDPAGFGLVQLSSLTYVDGRPALHVEEQDGTGAIANARVFPIRAQGPAVDPPLLAPTQRALAERPAACTAGEREHSPRVVAAFQAGTRHPVIVADGSESVHTLLSGFAVLHGSVEKPCLAALEAKPLSGDNGPAARESALIFPDDLEHAVLFRQINDARGSHIEYRNMSCRFDASVEIPAELRSQANAEAR